MTGGTDARSAGRPAAGAGAGGRPGTAGAEPALHVAERAAGSALRWSRLLDDAGRLAGLTWRLEPVVAVGADELLGLAGGGGEPWLVLPALGETGPPAAGRGVHRVVVPIDRSLAQRRLLRPWIERAEGLGMAVEVVHVLGRGSTPAMWEGAGHHAAAWRAELHRRHGAGPAPVQVQVGEPGDALPGVAGGADLVVVAWSGSGAPGRAPVLRALLVRQERPLLLVQGAPPPPATSPPSR